MCLGSDSFVTPEEFGYSRKQSAQCSHSSRNILGCAVALNLLFLGKGRFQVWFLPLNVRQGQITWGSQVLRACLRLRFITGGVCGGTSKLPTSLGAAGPLLGPPCPVFSCDRAGDMHGTTAAAHLLWGFASPQIPRCIFFLAGVSLGRFLVVNEPIFKIKNLFLEFCLTFFCSF